MHIQLRKLFKEISSFPFAGSEVLTAVIMKSFVFFDVKMCSQLKDKRRFGGNYGLHIQG
jgi:hypothetical protein